MAAFMQAWRNAFQKQLSTTVDVYGVTLARFIFALPLALIYISCLYHFQPVTEFRPFQSPFCYLCAYCGVEPNCSNSLDGSAF